MLDYLQDRVANDFPSRCEKGYNKVVRPQRAIFLEGENYNHYLFISRGRGQKRVLRVNCYLRTVDVK